MQLVKFYANGKPRAEIAKEFDITPSALDLRIKNHKATVSLAAKDNRTEEENELAPISKENQRLKMENDILKQAALIMGRK
ncbi:hypothetical protein [Lysinibacillus xylanilyticus]|uniref:hypothetical protein n=1 Tax=Lysinibacillus xylanilyticus TaxID=582475 RepID=UPI0036DC4589